MGRAQSVWGLPLNPVTRVEKHRARASGEIDVFTPEEVMALVRAAGSEQDAATFLTATFSEMRRGELLALRWREVEFTGSAVRVRASYAAGQLTTPKSGKVRPVPMAPDVAEALARLGRREHWTGDDDIVFCGQTGNYLDGSALRRRYTAALRRAGLRPLRFHDLRHTFGTRMIAKADIRRVQEWMGHADIQTTMRYLHFVPRDEDARLVAEAFQTDSVAEPLRNVWFARARPGTSRDVPGRPGIAAVWSPAADARADSLPSRTRGHRRPTARDQPASSAAGRSRCALAPRSPGPHPDGEAASPRATRRPRRPRRPASLPVGDASSRPVRRGTSWDGSTLCVECVFGDVLLVDGENGRPTALTAALQSDPGAGRGPSVGGSTVGRGGTDRGDRVRRLRQDDTCQRAVSTAGHSGDPHRLPLLAGPGRPPDRVDPGGVDRLPTVSSSPAPPGSSARGAHRASSSAPTPSSTSTSRPEAARRESCDDGFATAGACGRTWGSMTASTGSSCARSGLSAAAGAPNCSTD